MFLKLAILYMINLRQSIIHLKFLCYNAPVFMCSFCVNLLFLPITNFPCADIYANTAHVDLA